MDDLPAEMYGAIFRHLSTKEILTCSLVCRRMNEAVAKVTSAILLVNDRKLQVAKFNIASGNADTCFKNGALVRSLIIKSESHKKKKRPVSKI